MKTVSPGAAGGSGVDFTRGAPKASELRKPLPLCVMESRNCRRKWSCWCRCWSRCGCCRSWSICWTGATHKRVVACRGFAFPAAVSPSALVECVSHIKWASRGMVFGVMNVLARFFGLAKNRTRPLFRFNCNRRYTASEYSKNPIPAVKITQSLTASIKR